MILVLFRSIADDESQTPMEFQSDLYITAARGYKITLPSGKTVFHDGYFSLIIFKGAYMTGISTHRNCAQAAECIRQAGYDFVIRYYSRTTEIPEKRMLAAEARAIAAAGLHLGVVYQDAANKLRFFTRQRGVIDGRYAYNYATQDIGQPADSAIYFAVDFDFTSSQIQTAVTEYFRGVREGLEEAADGQPIYDIGVYGSGASCRIIRANLPFVRYSWLALATRWREYNTYAEWNIKQFRATENLCGLPASHWQRVEVRSDFGQFSLEAA
jgi:hypothetical protein